jgi:hypothetical protein
MVVGCFQGPDFAGQVEQSRVDSGSPGDLASRREILEGERAKMRG